MILGFIKYVPNCSPHKDISKEIQHQKLSEYTVNKIITDIHTKYNSTNIMLKNTIQELDFGDSIIVTKISRIASNMQELYDIISLVYEKNITLEVIELGKIFISNDKLNTSEWIKSLLELENDIRYEKRCIGHLKKKLNVQSEGSKITLSAGRPNYSTKQLVDALKLQNQYSIREISELTGISRNTLYRAKNKLSL